MLVYHAVTYGPLSWESTCEVQTDQLLAVRITGEWAWHVVAREVCHVPGSST